MLEDMPKQGCWKAAMAAGVLITLVTHICLLPMQVVRNYFTKRILRIVPSYYATLALVYCAFLPMLYSNATSTAPEARQAITTLWFNPGDGCPDKLWANFVFVNNQLLRAGCMKYAWSQAVQVRACLVAFLFMQISLVRPILKGCRRRWAPVCYGLPKFQMDDHRQRI